MWCTSELHRFEKVGWDFDNTLFGHQKSERLWAYIASSPPSQKHFIITFRTGWLLAAIWDDLKTADCPLHSGHFEAVFGVPDVIYQSFVTREADGSSYRAWKGKQCWELGIEVIIDDDTRHVQEGCQQFGVRHLHPDDIQDW